MTSRHLVGTVALVLAVLGSPGPSQAADAHAMDRPAPAFLGIAGLVLFGGLLGFGMFARNHCAPSEPGNLPRQTSAPDHLPVALAGTLARGSDGIAWTHALGTLFDLARRGVLHAITPDGASWLHRGDCTLVLSNRSADLREHERTLVDILFTPKSGPRETVRLSQLAQTFISSGGWKRFDRAVTDDLRQEGLLDAEREQARDGATRIGLGLVITAVAGFAAVLPIVDRIGGSALAIPGALMVSGVTGLIVGQTLTRFSDKGLQQARLWKAYGRHLTAVSNEAATDAAPGRFESLLPLAVAFGVALRWAKRLDGRGALPTPVWFRAEAPADGRAAHTATVMDVLSMATAAGAQVTRGAGVALGAVAAGTTAAGARSNG